ncbi:34597_t:CDS:2, partial [Racocetra persica]
KSVDPCVREKYMKERVHRIRGITNSTNSVESSNAPIKEEMIYDNSIEVDKSYNDDSNKDINFLPKKPRKFKENMKLSGYGDEKVGAGSEPFLGELLKPLKRNVNLQADLLELLVKYYHNLYDHLIYPLLEIHVALQGSIPVSSKIDQF